VEPPNLEKTVEVWRELGASWRWKQSWTQMHMWQNIVLTFLFWHPSRGEHDWHCWRKSTHKLLNVNIIEIIILLRLQPITLLPVVLWEKSKIACGSCVPLPSPPLVSPIYEWYCLLKCIKTVKSKSIPATGHRGRYGYEMLRIPHCLDSLLTGGGKVVSPTHRPLALLPRNIIFLLWVLISVRGCVNPRS
jgi:hypothetical protein